jgi:hypothetical protein
MKTRAPPCDSLLPSGQLLSLHNQDQEPLPARPVEPCMGLLHSEISPVDLQQVISVPVHPTDQWGASSGTIKNDILTRELPY